MLQGTIENTHAMQPCTHVSYFVVQMSACVQELCFVPLDSAVCIPTLLRFLCSSNVRVCFHDVRRLFSQPRYGKQAAEGRHVMIRAEERPRDERRQRECDTDSITTFDLATTFMRVTRST